jgi:hypothetical protein
VEVDRQALLIGGPVRVLQLARGADLIGLGSDSPNDRTRNRIVWSPRGLGPLVLLCICFAPGCHRALYEILSLRVGAYSLGKNTDSLWIRRVFSKLSVGSETLDI